VRSKSRHRLDHASPARRTTTGRCADQDVAVGVVERVENLRLDGVKVRKLAGVKILKHGVLQRRDRQRLQVEQIRVLEK